ncbi:MAG: GlsB/YeaQ/YmgE family stress response membrane protein [bacterium]
MFGILAWIVFGLIAGLIAKALMPGKDPGGCIITTLLGIVGAVIGGFIGRSLLGYGRATDSMGDISKPGFLMSLVLAVVGAIIVLAVYRLISGRRSRD